MNFNKSFHIKRYEENLSEHSEHSNTREISSTVGIVNFTPTERKHLCEFDIMKIYEFGIACRKIKCSIICYIFLIKNIVHIGLNHLLNSLKKLNLRIILQHYL